MGRTHAAAWEAIAGVEIAGVAGRDGIDALLDDDSVDAVDVCTPTATHTDLVRRALARGRHVLCETPFAETVDEADAMIAAAGDTGRILMVAQVLRSVGECIEMRLLPAPTLEIDAELNKVEQLWTEIRPILERISTGAEVDAALLATVSNATNRMIEPLNSAILMYENL